MPASSLPTLPGDWDDRRDGAKSPSLRRERGRCELGAGCARRAPGKTAGPRGFGERRRFSASCLPAAPRARGPAGRFNHRRAEPSRPSTRPSRSRASRTLGAATAASSDSPTLRTSKPRDRTSPSRGSESGGAFLFFLLAILKPKKPVCPSLGPAPPASCAGAPGLRVIRCVLL